MIALLLWTLALGATPPGLSSCARLHATPAAGDLAQVPGSWGTCLQVAQAAQDGGVPIPVALAVAYYETRLRPQLVGPAGELGVMQVHPGYFPAAKRDSLGAGIDALKTSTSFGRTRARALCSKVSRTKTQRRRCFIRVAREDPWRRGLAHYHGGVRPSWWYAEKVDRLRRRLRQPRPRG